MANYDDRLKDYVPVNERILAFYKAYPDGCLQSEIVQMTDKLVVVRARAHRTPDDRMPGIGHSSLTIPGPTSFTRGSELENAETSAWGRAIAALGFEVKRGIASREEIDSKKDESSEKKAGKVKTKPDQDLKGVEVCRARGHHNTQKIVDAQTNETSLACVDCGKVVPSAPKDKASSTASNDNDGANGVMGVESLGNGDAMGPEAVVRLRDLVESTKAPILLMMKQYAKGRKYELVDGELQTDITATEYEKLMEVLQKRKELNDAKELDLEQGSQRWLDFRQSGIGGSDASLIAAFFLDQPWPYGTWAGADLWKLWAQKTGRIKVKPARDRSDASTGYVDPFVHGHKTEPLARDWYSRTTGEFAPPAVLQSTEREFMFASLDGWNPESKVVLEIKCPKEKVEHNKAKEGQIPERYYAQFQHNLCVAEGTELHYVSFFEGDGVLTKVLPDTPFLTRLRDAEMVFWGWVEKKEFPLPTGDVEAGKADENWRITVERYFQAQGMLREAEARIAMVRKDIMQEMMMRGAGKLRGHGARASLRVRNEQTIRPFTKEAGLLLVIQEDHGVSED